MIHNKRLFLAAAIAAGTLAIAGCKKDAGAKEIELPEGQIHLGAQWAGNELWVESFDPKTATCTFSQYQNGKVVEASTITFKNCRAGAAGGPMMRPMMQGMPGRPGMNRPGMNRSGMAPPEGQPGMTPAKPATAPPAPATAPEQPAGN